METTGMEAGLDQRLGDPKPQIPFTTWLGVILIVGAAVIYATYGISAYPRPEWLIEGLAAVVFLIPVFNLTYGPGTFTSAVRILGAMLLLHSVWDALHWPGIAILNTPIDPWIPKVCPLIDIPVGFLLLIRGR